MIYIYISYHIRRYIYIYTYYIKGMYHEYYLYIDVYHIVGMQCLYCCCWFTVSEQNMYNLYVIYVCIYTGKKQTYINNSGDDNGDLNGIGYHRTNQQCMVFGC